MGNVLHITLILNYELQSPTPMMPSLYQNKTPHKEVMQGYFLPGMGGSKQMGLRVHVILRRALGFQSPIHSGHIFPAPISTSSLGYARPVLSLPSLPCNRALKILLYYLLIFKHYYLKVP